jgi:hypothetical protein
MEGRDRRTGAKRHEGQIRPDPWAVTEQVATAVAVRDRPHDHHQLFPHALRPRPLSRGRWSGSRALTQGSGLTDFVDVDGHAFAAYDAKPGTGDGKAGWLRGWLVSA